MVHKQSTLLGLPLELRLTIFRAASDEYQKNDFLACDHPSRSQENGRKFKLPINPLLNLRLTCRSFDSEISTEYPPIGLKTPTFLFLVQERQWKKSHKRSMIQPMPKVVVCSGLCIDSFMRSLTCLGRLSVQDLKINSRHIFIQPAQDGLIGLKSAGGLLLHDNRVSLLQQTRAWAFNLKNDHAAESFSMRDSTGNLRYTWVNQHELVTTRQPPFHYDWQRNKRFLYPHRNEFFSDMHLAAVWRDILWYLQMQHEKEQHEWFNPCVWAAEGIEYDFGPMHKAAMRRIHWMDKIELGPTGRKPRKDCCRATFVQATEAGRPLRRHSLRRASWTKELRLVNIGGSEAKPL